ncbi:MAG: hypothetical protein CMH83_13785 [Nocardioides sp.]|nr:hypothetical protein [Nocardioides sp.]
MSGPLRDDRYGGTEAQRALAEAEEHAARSDTEIATALRALRGQADAVRREHAAWRAGAAERAQRRAELARSGRVGADLQELQRRVDAGTSTWAAYVDGSDRHPAAVRARAVAERTITAWRERQDPTVRKPGPPTPGSG